MDFHAIFLTFTTYLGANWFGTVVTAAFGALAGGIVANRAHVRRTAITELNDISAALALCFIVTKRFLDFKAQIIGPLHDRYTKARNEVESAIKTGKLGGEVKSILFDLRTITPIHVPAGALEKYVFERISVRGRGTAAAADLLSSIDAVERTLIEHADLINHFRAHIEGAPGRQKIDRYFGFHGADDITDRRIHDAINGLYNHVDECLFFCRTLEDDLFEYGITRRKRLRRRLYRLGIPKFVRTDWSKPEQEKMFPARTAYAPWLSGFRKQPSKWESFRAWLRRLTGRTT